MIDIPIPPLSQRGKDILLLVNHFIEKFSKEMKRKVPEFSDAALKVLRHYAWPGNVRELENLVHRLVVIVDANTIDVADLPESMRFSINVTTGTDKSLADVEAEHITNVLHATGGNKTRAAGILKIDRKTLREKLKKIGA